MSSLRRGHANLLCIVPILVYVLPKRAQLLSFLRYLGFPVKVAKLILIGHLWHVIVVQSLSRVWLCDPVNYSTPGFSVLHYFSEFAQTHVHWASEVHPTFSSSVTHFSSPQPFAASGSFQMSQFFTLGGQSIWVSASASVLPMNIQNWFPSGLTGLISLQSKRLSKSLLQYHSLKVSVLQGSAFFMVWCLHLYITPRKTIALTNHSSGLCGQSDVSTF